MAKTTNVMLAALTASMLTATGAYAATEDRDVDAFTEIEIDGAMELIVQVGGSQSVTIETEDEDDLDRVETEVRRGRLVIDQRGRHWDNELTVRITVPSLNGLFVDGAAEAELTGLNAEDFVLRIAGAADVFMSGTCGSVEYRIDGAGDVDAEEFECRNVEILVNGAGDLDVYASESIEATLNGVGDVKVYGNPTSVRPQING